MINKKMVEEKEQKNKEEKEKYEKEIKDLVIARLRTIPSDTLLSIGGKGDFKIEELIDFVEKEDDEIGKMVIETEIDYIRSFTNLPLEEQEK